MRAFLEQSWVQVLFSVASWAVRLGFGHDEGEEYRRGEEEEVGVVVIGREVARKQRNVWEDPPRSIVEDSMGDEWPMVTYVATWVGRGKKKKNVKGNHPLFTGKFTGCDCS